MKSTYLTVFCLFLLASIATSAQMDYRPRTLIQDNSGLSQATAEEMSDWKQVDKAVPKVEEQNKVNIKVSSTAVGSPCPQGQTASANDVQIQTDGCGSKWWHKHLIKVLPYNSMMQKCCHGHDTCYRTCAGTGFSSAFSECNRKFRNCMWDECRAAFKSGSFWDNLKNAWKYQKCRLTGHTLYNLTKHFGGKHYNAQQKNHCKCA